MIYVFFLSLHRGERQKDHEPGISFQCWDVRDKAITSPVPEGTVRPVLEGQGPSLGMCAVFLSQLLRMMSPFGDSWKINFYSGLGKGYG